MSFFGPDAGGLFHRVSTALPALSLLALSALVSGACTSPTSELWGRNGERWDPAGRLPDFSYAGYHQGEKPIPDVPVVASVNLPRHLFALVFGLGAAAGSCGLRRLSRRLLSSGSTS